MKDHITQLLLVIIATFLGTLVVRPVLHPDQVRAESAEAYPLLCGARLYNNP